MPTVENNKKEQGKRNEKTTEECKQARANATPPLFHHPKCSSILVKNSRHSVDK